MKLPICTPSILSYLHHAHPLAIIESDDRARPYLLNTFLQLHSRENYAPGVGRGTVVDFYSHDGMYPRYPLLNWAWLSGPLVHAMSANPVRSACNALETGCYLEATLDEFYLGKKAGYRQEHVPHQNLIYGYSAEERVFYARGFTYQLSFSDYIIGFDEFAEGLATDCGIGFITRTDALEYQNSMAFSPRMVHTYLTDFLEARSSFMNYCPDDARYGVATYEVALEKLARHNGGQMDLQPWCVFYEHKTKLRVLARHLADEHGIVFASQVLNELIALERDFLGLRNHLVEARMVNAVVRPEAVRANLKRITVAESMVVGALSDAVRTLF